MDISIGDSLQTIKRKLEYIPEYVLYYLEKEDLTAKELADKIPYSRTNIMKRVRIFRKEGKVGSEKRGETQLLTYFIKTDKKKKVKK